ncbi:MAG: hypothetical protein ACK4S4_09360 [Pyrinomonadaceae bacterium]
MLKIKASQRVVRETTAPFEYSDNGETKSVDIRVRYYSPTIKDLHDHRREVQTRQEEQPDNPMMLSDVLARRLESLPDLSDDKGKPIKITVAALEEISIRNLTAIQRAINEDLEGK